MDGSSRSVSAETVDRRLGANLGGEIAAAGRHLPRLIFMHFWANDDALKLARGSRDDRQNREQDERKPCGRVGVSAEPAIYFECFATSDRRAKHV